VIPHERVASERSSLMRRAIQTRNQTACGRQRDFVYRGTIDVASIRIWLREPSSELTGHGLGPAPDDVDSQTVVGARRGPSDLLEGVRRVPGEAQAVQQQGCVEGQ
jgi:hypothetical protein